MIDPVGPQAPPRRPLRLRVNTRYAGGGAPPMDYRDNHLCQQSKNKRLACLYNEHENPFGMMPERAVSKIGRYEFALVHPGVKREEVLRNTSPFSDRGERMVIRMCH